MPELSLPFGPWRKLVSADWSGRPLSVYINDESLLLLTAFDKAEDGSVRGLLTLLKKPMLLEGSAEAFSSSQKRELVFVEKRSPDYHVKYALVESTPYYINYEQSELAQTLQRQHQELEGLTKILIDAAAAFDVKLRELSAADPRPMELLIGDPFTLFSLSGVPPSGEGLRSSGKVPRLKLGLDLQNAEYDVRLTSIDRVFVIGENKSTRLKALQVLCEAAMLAGVPCLVFDSTKTLSGLAVPTKDTAALETFGMVSLAAAFPFRAYALGKGLFADLRAIALDLFEKSLGIYYKEIHPVLETAYPDSSSLQDLIDHVSAIKETKVMTNYAIAKALRALRVLQKAYSAVFGKNTFAELSSPWEVGVPKVYYVDLSSLDPVTQELLMISLLAGLKNPPTPAALACVFEPSTDELSTVVKKLISEKKNVGFFLHAGHEADFNPLKNPSLTLDLVGDHVIASEPNKEKKRFRIRPCLTLFTAAGV